MPYTSEAQRKYFNANREKLEAEGVDVDEWNESSKGKKLPEKKSYAADTSFADDYDDTQLREALAERVRMIAQLRAHRDSLLDAQSGYMPEKKAYGVSDDDYEQDRHLSAMPGSSREEMLAATRALMARAKTLDGNLKFTGSRYAELPDEYYDSDEALKRIEALEGDNPYFDEESPLFYQISRDDQAPLNWDALDKQASYSVAQNMAWIAAQEEKAANLENKEEEEKPKRNFLPAGLLAGGGLGALGLSQGLADEGSARLLRKHRKANLDNLRPNETALTRYNYHASELSQPKPFGVSTSTLVPAVRNSPLVMGLLGQDKGHAMGKRSPASLAKTRGHYDAYAKGPIAAYWHDISTALGGSKYPLSPDFREYLAKERGVSLDQVPKSYSQWARPAFRDYLNKELLKGDPKLGTFSPADLTNDVMSADDQKAFLDRWMASQSPEAQKQRRLTETTHTSSHAKPKDYMINKKKDFLDAYASGAGTAVDLRDGLQAAGGAGLGGGAGYGLGQLLEKAIDDDEDRDNDPWYRRHLSTGLGVAGAGAGAISTPGGRRLLSKLKEVLSMTKKSNYSEIQNVTWANSMNNLPIQNLAVRAAGANQLAKQASISSFLLKYGPKALSVGRKLGKGTFNTADLAGQASGAVAGSMGDVLIDPEQRKALAKGDFGNTNLWDNEATGLENTENLWRRGFTGLATGSVTRPRYLTKSYAHGRNALNKSLADGANVPNKMDLGHYLSGMAKETVPKLKALGIGYGPGMVADIAATPAALREGSEATAATAKKFEETAKNVSKDVENISNSADLLVSGDKDNPDQPSISSILNNIQGAIGTTDPTTGEPTGNSVTGVLGDTGKLLQEAKNVVNNEKDPDAGVAGTLSKLNSTADSVKGLIDNRSNSPTAKAVSQVGDLAETANSAITAVQSGFKGFTDWAVKNQKALGIGALGAAGVYGLYRILKGRAENEEEEDDQRRNYVFRLPKRAADFGKLAAGRCWDGYEPVPGKKAYSDGSCQPAGGKKKKKKKSEKKSSDIAVLAEIAVMQKQAKNTALDSSLKVSPHTAIFGGTLGAGVGGLHGLLKDPGYDEETGDKKSRLLNALKGLGMGGALGAGAGAILPPASVLATQGYGKFLSPIHEQISRLQEQAKD